MRIKVLILSFFITIFSRITSSSPSFYLIETEDGEDDEGIFSNVKVIISSQPDSLEFEILCVGIFHNFR